MNSIYNITERTYITSEFCLDEIHKVMTIIYEDLKNYDINDMSKLSFNPRLKKCLGRCHRCQGVYDIQLNSTFLSVGSLNKIKDVIAHECVHLVPGCWDHGKKFKLIASQLSQYGYNVTRCTGDEEYMKLRSEEKSEKIQYIPHCKHCGKKMKAYVNMTKAIKIIAKGNNDSRRYFFCPLCNSRDLEIIKRYPNGKELIM